MPNNHPSTTSQVVTPASLSATTPSGYFASIQAGIHMSMQTTTAHRFRLQATGMTTRAKVGMTGIRRGVQSGFTLLEMVLVLFLIGLMASATLMLTENVEDQAKYDETKRRIEMMRKAIVGDPTRTINGGPEISGFVADMGELPECIAELLRARNCADDTGLTLWSLDLSTGLGFGWRGPYIHILPERSGELRFRDGYGNTDAFDAQNSGWKVFGVSATDISVASYSFDVANTTDDITVDPLIVSADWQVQLPATVNVTFKNQSAGDLPITDEDLMLLIYDFGLSLSASSAILTLNTSSAQASTSKTENFILNSTPTIPQGNRAYAVVCFDVPSGGTTDTYVIFDGDCSLGNDPQSTSNIRIFSVVPRQSLNLNLDWIIP